MSKLIIKPFVLLTILLSIILYFYNYFLPVTSFIPWLGFLFIAIITLLLILGLSQLHQLFPDFTGFGFLALMMLKLVVITMYLLPHIKGDQIYPKTDIFFFSILYFSYLIFEVLIVIKLLNKK